MIDIIKPSTTKRAQWWDVADGAADLILDCVERKGCGGFSAADGILTAIFPAEEGGRLDNVMRTKFKDAKGTE